MMTLGLPFLPQPTILCQIRALVDARPTVTFPAAADDTLSDKGLLGLFVYAVIIMTTKTTMKNNSNNNYDNVCGAIIMTKVIARVHPVHLMNVD